MEAKKKEGKSCVVSPKLDPILKALVDECDRHEWDDADTHAMVNLEIGLFNGRVYKGVCPDNPAGKVEE
jgi:hypothetical protein